MIFILDDVSYVMYWQDERIVFLLKACLIQHDNKILMLRLIPVCPIQILTLINLSK